MSRHVSRRHVFSLTPDEQAAVELYSNFRDRYASANAFAREAGISGSWLSNALIKALEVSVIEADKERFGFTSLSRGRGHIRMQGTR